MAMTPTMQSIREAMANNVEESRLLNLLKERDMGLTKMRGFCPQLCESQAAWNCARWTAFRRNWLHSHGDQKLVWRSISLDTLTSNKGLLTEATWFSSFGAALSWRVANRIWLQSESHHFCWVAGLVDQTHDGMVSTNKLGFR
eukprot:6458401-Amphidinium_carterae.1